MAFAFSPFSSSRASSFPDAYDASIKRAVDLYWGGYPDWLGWKAQLYQESHLKPEAISPVGARGLAQFMPGTWRDVTRQLALPQAASPHDARYAIEAGAYYMAKLRAQWKAPRAALEREQLTQASYNAGLGNIMAAQKRCGSPLGYAETVACLPGITGRSSAETIAYVRMIAHWRSLMAAEGLH
ncbi:MAG: transglycosylase SLT domain-containing protein [Parvibaculum sedimenti]|uniref:transglycosylase SLT domain-containing protein n=1 Tax=Parvibaculum sedimenti TaxID=2608632 RepID=UPI003BB7EC46